MPTYRFLEIGPSDADVQQECPGFTIVVADPTPTRERLVEADSAAALPYLRDYFETRGYRYDGEVV